MIDSGYLGIVSLRVDHDLGFQERHELFGEFIYFHDEQTTEDTFDVQAFVLNVGGVYHSPLGFDVVPSVFRTHLRLSRATLFQDVGVNLRFEREFGPRIKAFASARLSDQTFSPISENTTSPERDGRQIEGSVGATFVIGPTMQIAADYLHFDKRAKGGNIAGRGIFKFFSYDRDQVRLTHTWLLGGGQFVLNHFSYQRDRYEEPDPDVSERTRHDDIFRYRLTYGAPLGFFFGRGTLWRAIEDITLSASAELLEARSNLNNFEFRNVKVQGLLSKTWRF